MAQIKILPSEIVNRIAAGEVIERPASVVKELVENAIDAGSSEILIEVEKGGQRRIRVRDNGSGMSPEDLPLAFRSHATSKLPLGDGGGASVSPPALELFRINTLGFRGEALASIAAVAEVEAISRPQGADCAYRFRVRAGVPAGQGAPGERLEPVAAPPGTSVEVRDLFFNLPARRKFLRSSSTELSHILDQVVRLALGFPGIRFTLVGEEGRRLLDCPATSILRERLAAVIGPERARELIEIREVAEGELRIQGFVGPPHLHRPDTRGQHFFVDGRWVRDRVLGHAVQEAYRGFQIPGQRPLAYLFLDVPPGAVDVNVHPQKCEVRFLDSGAVHRAAHGAVQRALERSKDAADRAGQLTSTEEIGDPGGVAGLRARGEPDPPSPAQPVPALPVGRAGEGRYPDAEEARERSRAAALDFFPTPRRDREEQRIRPHGTGGRPEPADAPPTSPLQILRSYILLEGESSIVLFDQHALHEKVLYERLLAALEGGTMPRQKLLIPEVVELPLELAPLVGQIAERLEPLGFEVEPFGPREAAVHSIPAILGEAPAGPIVLEVGRWLLSGWPTPEEGGAGDGSAGADPLRAELRRLAQMVACKRAVKAGMTLKPEEIQELLRGAESARDPRFCPHGRPTSVVISQGEIERRFQRR